MISRRVQLWPRADSTASPSRAAPLRHGIMTETSGGDITRPGSVLGRFARQKLRYGFRVHRSAERVEMHVLRKIIFLRLAPERRFEIVCGVVKAHMMVRRNRCNRLRNNIVKHRSRCAEVLQARMMNINETARPAHETDHGIREIVERLLEVGNLRSMILSHLRLRKSRQELIVDWPSAR